MSVKRVQVTEQSSCSFLEVCDNLRVYNFIIFQIGKSFLKTFLIMHFLGKVGDKSILKQDTSAYLL